jgi:RHS repeat-associated protein
LLADEQFLAGMTTPNTKWALSDHQGTIKDIVDYNPATGVASVDRHRKYDPFGDRRGAALPTDIVFGYTGKYFDEVTGLQNNWNRWYDPKQGRFISQDPIGFAAGDENLYRYVGNRPTISTDPSGLITEEEWLALLREMQARNNARRYAEPEVTESTSMHGTSIHLNDAYFTSRNMPIPTIVCHGRCGLGRVGPPNSFRFPGGPGELAGVQYYSEWGVFGVQLATMFLPTKGLGKSPVTSTTNALSGSAYYAKNFSQVLGNWSRANGYAGSAYNAKNHNAILSAWLRMNAPSSAPKVGGYLSAPTHSNPWMPGAPVYSVPAPKGLTIEMVMAPGQTRPGAWGTVDVIADMSYARNQLAITPGFKPSIGHVQRFEVPAGTQVQYGTVGPQTHGGVTYPGGGSQIQILNYADRAKLIPVGPPIPLQ